MGSPEKSQSYQASIQCCAIIGPLFVVFGSFLPLPTKNKNVRVGLPLTRLSGSAHVDIHSDSRKLSV